MNKEELIQFLKNNLKIEIKTKEEWITTLVQIV